MEAAKSSVVVTAIQVQTKEGPPGVVVGRTRAHEGELSHGIGIEPGFFRESFCSKSAFSAFALET